MNRGLHPLYTKEGNNSGHGGTSSTAARYASRGGRKRGGALTAALYSVATAKGYGTRQSTRFPHGAIPSLFGEACIDSSAARIFRARPVRLEDHVYRGNQRKSTATPRERQPGIRRRADADVDLNILFWYGAHIMNDIWPSKLLHTVHQISAKRAVFPLSLRF